jgi:putative Mg2+ transporter-C (MgtC) family protein
MGDQTMFHGLIMAELTGKILLAALLGGAIGYEREAHGQAAGLRTNILVGMGACLMMMLSLQMEEMFRGLESSTVVRLDPARIASYAIASMGFLGAGAIIKGKGSVRGLTTAASLWLVTGLGLSVGAGFFVPACFTTLMSVLILYGLRTVKAHFARDIFTLLELTCRGQPRPLEKIKEILADYPEIKVQFINYRHDVANRTVNYRLRLNCRENMPWGQISNRLLQMPGLEEIFWEEGDVP